MALAVSNPEHARTRFPGYRLTHLVAARLDMDATDLEALETLIDCQLCLPADEMPRRFHEHLQRMLNVHALGALFRADGNGPHHHVIRPAGYDFDADEVIPAGMERWRADYRAMSTERQMLAASIVWLFRAGADNCWLRRVPMTWHGADAVDLMKRSGVLKEWAQLIAFYPGW